MKYDQGMNSNRNSSTPNRIPGLSVYLGSEPERSRRVSALKRMAERLHVTTSEMFRMLADGELSLIVTPATMTAPRKEHQGARAATSVAKAKAKPDNQNLAELMN